MKNLHDVPKGTMGAPGQIVATIAEIRTIMGDAYDQPARTAPAGSTTVVTVTPRVGARSPLWLRGVETARL